MNKHPRQKRAEIQR